MSRQPVNDPTIHGAVCTHSQKTIVIVIQDSIIDNYPINADIDINSRIETYPLTHTAQQQRFCKGNHKRTRFRS